MDRTTTTTAARDEDDATASVGTLVGAGVLDAELAALLSILVEARVPLVVAGAGDPGSRESMLAALLTALPPAARRIPLAGVTEDFSWLPEADELGWRSDGPTPGRDPLTTAEATSTVLLAGDLSTDPGGAALGGILRIAVRACALGYGLALSIEADSLDAVFARLRGARLTDDELSRLGVVLVLGDVGGRTRAIATHLIRPVARDLHGHVQRLGPAVLATYDAEAERFEHFAWGVMPELAMRVDRRPGDLEQEIEQRREAIEQAPA